MRKQTIALVNNFRMAWRLIRSSLSQNGKVYIIKCYIFYSIFTSHFIACLQKIGT